MKLRAKNYDLRLILGLSLIGALALMFFERSKELGLNLFTEITGVAITVFVINKILERKERQKRIAIDQRILRELQIIIASYFSIWKHLVWKFYPQNKIITENDLLRIYPELIQTARLDERFEIVSIHHPESWKLFFHNRSIKACFENYGNILTENIHTFINDFKTYIEPELLSYLLNIQESEYFKNIYMMTQDEMTKVLVDLEQDPDKLDSYINSDQTAHIRHFTELMNYSLNLRATILKFSSEASELYEIRKYFIQPAEMLNPVFKA
jgi:hypothetical protein